MTFDDSNPERERWLAALRSASPAEGSGCSDGATIWRGARGELPRAELAELLDHAAACPECLEAWRLARAFDRETEAGVRRGAPRGGTRSLGWAVGAVAVGVAAVGIALWLGSSPPAERGGPPATYRAPEGDEIRSILPEEAALPRAAAVLEWTPGPPGSRYDVAVTTPGFEPLAEAHGLEAPRFALPPAALERLASGDAFLWQVTVRRPDGTRRRSVTFIHQIE